MNNTKHTPRPLNKAVHAITMLYAEAFAGSNNKEFVVELYKDAQLLETAAPAMYEALRRIKVLMESGDIEGKDWMEYGQIVQALAQAEGNR